MLLQLSAAINKLFFFTTLYLQGAPVKNYHRKTAVKNIFTTYCKNFIKTTDVVKQKLVRNSKKILKI